MTILAWHQRAPRSHVLWIDPLFHFYQNMRILFHMTNAKYWACARCDGTDLYQAPRVIGQRGIATGFDIGDAHIGGVGASQAVEGMVLLCRSCGERAVQKERPMTAEEEEAYALKFAQEAKSGMWVSIISLIVIIVSVITIIRL